jgi:predicted P-loop ATPase/GTPase
MTILVAGGDRVDAGKTTFATGLLSRLPPGTPVFKPRAGNDFWFDHDDARTALSDGRLYGKDVARLVTAADTGATEERRNPVHRLWKPSPGRTGMLGERGRTFLVDRVRTPEETVFVVNDNVELPDAVTASLPLDEAIPVASVGEFNEVMQTYHLPALDAVRETVADADPAVVESYADIADPLGSVSYDTVAVVEPGRCRVFDGSRWEIARETVAGDGREGQLEERVESVTDRLDPLDTVSIPPLTSDERADPATVAARNEAAYESILRATGD